METVPLDIHRFKSKKGASVSEEFALFNSPFGQSKYCQYLINRQGILKLKSPRCFLLSFMSIVHSVQEKKLKIDFKHGDHFKFLIGTILAIFNL